MEDKIIRTSLLSHTPLTGWYRYADLFQLIPAPPEAPRPPSQMGDYPLILELRFDPRIPPDRSTDTWHRDQWERDRDNELSKQPGATDEWLAAYRRSTEWRRSQALVTELTVLLTTLAVYTFFTYDGDQSWFLPFDPSHAGAAELEEGQQDDKGWLKRSAPRHSEGADVSPVWGQTFYSAPGAVGAPGGGFSEPVGESAPLVPRGQRMQDQWVISESHRMELPDHLNALFDLYFTLEHRQKEAFYAASHLWVQCSALKSKAPSLSLVAAASAVETLVRVEEPRVKICPTCSAPESLVYCVRCRAPIYRLRRGFIDFFETYGGPTLGDFADRLYDFRSGISHSGRLLRKEFFDAGFNIGGKDEQMLFGIDVPRLARGAIVNWLRTKAGNPRSA